MYTEECIYTFLKNQGQLFDEPVAETYEEAEEFLEEVKQYLDELGADVDGMSLEDIRDASEVFELPDGTWLVVEG